MTECPVFFPIGCGIWQAGQGGAKCRAAGAVVTKDVAPWSVVGGNPARVVGKREIRAEKV